MALTPEGSPVTLGVIEKVELATALNCAVAVPPCGMPISLNNGIARLSVAAVPVETLTETVACAVAVPTEPAIGMV